MKCEMTIEYLKCRADLSFKINFGINGTIGMIVTKWDVTLFGQWFVFIHNIFFLNTHHMALIVTIDTNYNVQYVYLQTIIIYVCTYQCFHFL